MNHKSTKPTDFGIRKFETRVDNCGQSHFEVWLPIDELEKFDRWFDESVRDLESKFADFVTIDSTKRAQRR